MALGLGLGLLNKVGQPLIFTITKSKLYMTEQFVAVLVITIMQWQVIMVVHKTDSLPTYIIYPVIKFQERSVAMY